MNLYHLYSQCQKISSTDVNCFRPVPSMQLLLKNDVGCNLWHPDMRQNKYTAMHSKNAFIFRFTCQTKSQFFCQRLEKLSLFRILIFLLSFGYFVTSSRGCLYLALLIQDDLKHSLRTRFLVTSLCYDFLIWGGGEGLASGRNYFVRVT